MEVLIPIIAVGGFFIMIILLRQFSNKERMLMIEKGADPSQFKITQNNTWPLIIGSLAIGAGIGLVIANFLDANLNMDEVVYPAMVFIFGGIGLIVGRKMVQKEEK